MSSVFHKFQYRADQAKEASRSPSPADNDEAVARQFLNDNLLQDERDVMRGIAAPEKAELVPDLKLTSSLQLKSGGRLLRFEQVQRDRPVFGSAATVELTPNQTPVGAMGAVAQVEDGPVRANLSEREALEKVAVYTGQPAGELEKSVTEAAHLYYFKKDDKDVWHLAFLFKDVPALPAIGQGLSDEPDFDPSPRDVPMANYLVDAINGDILFYYGSAPTASGPANSVSKPPSYPIPVNLKGVDELGTQQRFYGNEVGNPPSWELHDVDRRIKTYDLELQNIATATLPTECVRNDQPFFANQKAAVSAHVNASRVYKFFKAEMNRDGIDNNGMDLISMVNCTYGSGAPVWQNAMWWKDRMWYGQRYDENNNLRSYSQYLDVIAHELTHGVTKSTADLVYQGQSGALNESISDIFGIIIKNWYLFEAEQAKRDDVGNWNWQIGEKLGKGGNPLRDFSNPGLTGDPDHMSKFDTRPGDFGRVHTNSNIHNKAAYNFLTARNGTGQQVFLPEEVAQLYYQVLLRLNPLAQFTDILTALLNVAETYYPDPQERSEKTAAIRGAYANVGINE